MFSKKSPIALVLVIVMLASLLMTACGTTPKTSETPVDHLRTVEEKALNEGELLGHVVNAYDSILSKLPQTSGTSKLALALNVGQELTTLAETALAEGGMPLELEWLSNIVLELEAAITESQYALNLGLGLNNTVVIDGGAQIDLTTGNVFAGVPTVNSQWIAANINELAGQDVTAMFNTGMADAMAMAAALSEDLPASKALETMLKDYIMLAWNQISQVERLEETVTVGGMEQTYTVLKATVTQQDLYNIAIAALEKAQNDATFRALVEAVCNYYNGIVTMTEEMNDYTYMETLDANTVFEEIPGLIEELKAMEADPENYLYLYTYVDKKDVVQGRAVEIPSDEIKVSYITVWDGDKFATEIIMPEDTKIIGSGEEKKDVVTGAYTLNVMGEDMVTLELDGFKMADGNATGTLKLVPGQTIMDNILYNVDGTMFSSLLNTADVALEVVLGENTLSVNLLLNDSKLFGMDLAMEIQDTANIQAPSNYTNIASESDIQTWMSGLSVDQVLENLGTAGVPEEYVQMLQQMLASALYGGY